MLNIINSEQSINLIKSYFKSERSKDVNVMASDQSVIKTE